MRIYRGDSTSYFKIMYTFDGKYIYQGDSTSYSKIIATYSA